MRVHDRFRILALSATPGNSVKDIQQVLSNLCIAKLEVHLTFSYRLCAPYIPHWYIVVPPRG